MHTSEFLDYNYMATFYDTNKSLQQNTETRKNCCLHWSSLFVVSKLQANDCYGYENVIKERASANYSDRNEYYKSKRIKDWA